MHLGFALLEIRNIIWKCLISGGLTQILYYFPLRKCKNILEAKKETSLQLCTIQHHRHLVATRGTAAQMYLKKKKKKKKTLFV